MRSARCSAVCESRCTPEQVYEHRYTCCQPCATGGPVGSACGACAHVRMCVCTCAHGRVRECAHVRPCMCAHACARVCACMYVACMLHVCCMMSPGTSGQCAIQPPQSIPDLSKRTRACALRWCVVLHCVRACLRCCMRACERARVRAGSHVCMCAVPVTHAWMWMPPHREGR